MNGRVAALYRHPVKGLTPERLEAATLEAGRNFPCDRRYAVERGPSGFDPKTPRHISKQRFVVLANHPELARVRSTYAEATQALTVETADAPAERFSLATGEGRAAFADWLAVRLEDEPAAPLRLIDSGGEHRFTDDAAGWVSVVNLASLDALAQRVGRSIDPLRLRANVLVDGWPPWAEMDWPAGSRLTLGAAELEVAKAIPRCVATHVDPKTGVRDLNLVPALRRDQGHVCCGLYLSVVRGGRVAQGDVAMLGSIT